MPRRQRGYEGDVTADPRLTRLLDAVLTISRDIELEAVLARIVESACSLVEAKYGAVGVINPDGSGLSAFLHHGVDEATVQRIGELPAGRGILGLLIDEPVPLRLDDLAEHPASYGFPPGHPPMKAFLGTPIRVHDEVYGNLYLTEKLDGTSFTQQDEDLVVGLAAVAGSAIRNARLYDETRRRGAWRAAVLEVSGAVLGGANVADVRHRVARLGASLVDADSASLVAVHEDGLWVLAAAGQAPPVGRLDVAATAVRDTLRTGDISRVDYGPLFGKAALWVPVRQGDQVVAALGVGRAAPFLGTEADLLAAFADQVSLAWTFELAQADVRRLSLIEDRERIGRDLHDTVIQRLFATGLSLQAVIRRCDDRPDVAERIERAVSDIDDTVKEIRTTIFALQPSGAEERGVRSQVLRVLEELAELLPRPPRVRFEGPIDTIAGSGVLEHLVPAVREILTNVAKHAHASDIEVELTAAHGQLELRVTDNGRGIDSSAPRGFGLANLKERAKALGGELRLESGVGGRGTRAVWRVPTA